MTTWGSIKRTAHAQVGPLCFGLACALPFIVEAIREAMKGLLK